MFICRKHSVVGQDEDNFITKINVYFLIRFMLSLTGEEISFRIRLLFVSDFPNQIEKVKLYP